MAELLDRGQAPEAAHAVRRIEVVIATDAYELATTAVVLVDRSERAKLLLTGAGAAEFLQGQVTNDVEALAPGEGCYAAFLNHKGKLRADVRVLRVRRTGSGSTPRATRSEVLSTWVIDSLGRLDVVRDDLTDERASSR